VTTPTAEERAREEAERRIPTTPREKFIQAAEERQRQAQRIFIDGYLAGYAARGEDDAALTADRDHWRTAAETWERKAGEEREAGQTRLDYTSGKCDRLKAEIDRLRAEVERLRASADALADRAEWFCADGTQHDDGCRCRTCRLKRSVAHYRAALTPEDRP